MPSVIPHELVPEIVGHLRDDIATLRSANLICHEWHHWVSPVVMRSVAVVRGPALDELVSWARSADRIVGTRDPLDHILQFKLLKGNRPNELAGDTLTCELAQFGEAMKLLRAVRMIRMDVHDVSAIQGFLVHRLMLEGAEFVGPSTWPQMFFDAQLERQNTIQSLLPLMEALNQFTFDRAARRRLNQFVQDWPRKHLIKAIEVDASAMLYDRVLDGYDNLAILNIHAKARFPAIAMDPLLSLIPTKHLIALKFDAISSKIWKEASFTNLQFDNLRFISISIYVNRYTEDEGPVESIEVNLRRLLNSASNLDTVRVTISAFQFLGISHLGLIDVLIEQCPRLVALRIESNSTALHIRHTPTRASLDAIAHLHVSATELLRYILDECTADWFARLRTLVVMSDSVHDDRIKNCGYSIKAIGAIVKMLRDIEFLQLEILLQCSYDINSYLDFAHDLVATLCSDCQRLSRLDLGFWRHMKLSSGVDFGRPLRELLEGSRSLKTVVVRTIAYLGPDYVALAQSRGISLVRDLGEGVFSFFRDQDRILGLN